MNPAAANASACWPSAGLGGAGRVIRAHFLGGSHRLLTPSCASPRRAGAGSDIVIVDLDEKSLATIESDPNVAAAGRGRARSTPSCCAG